MTSEHGCATSPGRRALLAAVAVMTSTMGSGCFVPIADPAPPRETGGAASSGGAPGSGASGSGASSGATECDADFGAPRPKGQSAVAVRFSPTGGADPIEWTRVAKAAMDESCSACQPSQPGQQPGEFIVNAPYDAADLQAEFGVAWDDLALYVFAQVLDDDIVALDRASPEKQDGIELFLDGAGDRTKGYGPDDHHLFVGAIGENVFAKNAGDVGPSGRVTVTRRIRTGCYFVEVRLPWFYVVGLVAHAPMPGNRYGFTIAVNDWDSPPTGTAPGPARRENQLFWAVPGTEYAYDTAQFGSLRLE